ncbi:hypothetical protein BD410DRAFT_827982 [Rickenella mellea]|uniref:Zn(2)-C6 fungal-type domain-containing protein n=1 Tax=Rickenella mellea TaxID=50990 RepID=A0A4Y7Q6Z0_9AGAM|nr:hypothetical protein BD410DRAFT_827982 [Rickenella mellea]
MPRPDDYDSPHGVNIVVPDVHNIPAAHRARHAHPRTLPSTTHDNLAPMHPASTSSTPSTSYTLMVAGQSKGKTSFLRLLLDTAVIAPSASPEQVAEVARFVQGAPARTTHFRGATIDVLPDPADPAADHRRSIALTVIDTPSLDSPSLERSLAAMLSFVEARFTESLEDEHKARNGDHHVHLINTPSSLPSLHISPRHAEKRDPIFPPISNFWWKQKHSRPGIVLCLLASQDSLSLSGGSASKEDVRSPDRDSLHISNAQFHTHSVRTHPPISAHLPPPLQSVFRILLAVRREAEGMGNILTHHPRSAASLPFRPALARFFGRMDSFRLDACPLGSRAYLEARTRTTAPCIYLIDPDTIVPIPTASARSSPTTSLKGSTGGLTPPSLSSPSHTTIVPPSLPETEIQIIRRLSTRVNVLPVIARADTLTTERLVAVKNAVRRDLAVAGIGFGIFDTEYPFDGGARGAEEYAKGSVPPPPAMASSASGASSKASKTSSSSTSSSSTAPPMSMTTATTPSTPTSPSVISPGPPFSSSFPSSSSGSSLSANGAGGGPVIPRLPHAIMSPDMYAHGEGVVYSSYAHPRSGHPTPGSSGMVPPPPSRQELMRRYTPSPSLLKPALIAAGERFMRTYRWGAIDVLDPAHCDFAYLRAAVFHHMVPLKTYTRDYLFAKFRSEWVQARPQHLSRPPMPIVIDPSPPPLPSGPPSASSSSAAAMAAQQQQQQQERVSLPQVHYLPPHAQQLPPLSSVAGDIDTLGRAHAHAQQAHAQGQGQHARSHGMSGMGKHSPDLELAHASAILGRAVVGRRSAHHAQTAPYAGANGEQQHQQHQHQQHPHHRALPPLTLSTTSTHRSGPTSPPVQSVGSASASASAGGFPSASSASYSGGGHRKGEFISDSHKQKNKKITVACNFCRSRKLKCDGGRPACSQCIKRTHTCDYMPQAKRRGGTRQTRHAEDGSVSDAYSSDDNRIYDGDERVGEDTGEVSPAYSSPQDGHAHHGLSPQMSRTTSRRSSNVDMLIAETLHSPPSASERDRDRENGNGNANGGAYSPLSTSNASSSAVERRVSGGEGSGGYMYGMEKPLIAPLPFSSANVHASGPSVPQPTASPPVPIRPASEAQAAQRKRAAISGGKGARSSSNYGPKVVACNFCRARKTKCDGVHPSCSSCARRSLSCNYVNDPGTNGNGTGSGRKKNSAATSVSEPATPVTAQGSAHGQDSPNTALSRAHSPPHSAGVAEASGGEPVSPSTRMKMEDRLKMEDSHTTYKRTYVDEDDSTHTSASKKYRVDERGDVDVRAGTPRVACAQGNGQAP